MHSPIDPVSRRLARRSGLCAALVGTLLGTGCESPEPTPRTKAPPPVAPTVAEPKAELLLDKVLATELLPTSLRTDEEGPPPGARQVVVNSTQIRVNGKPLGMLRTSPNGSNLFRGRPNAKDLDGALLPALRDVLRGPGSKALALRAHDHVPYPTVFSVLHSARVAGMRDLWLKVVEEGKPNVSSWLHLRGFGSLAQGDELDVRLLDKGKRYTWDHFAARWDDAHTACTQQGFSDCPKKPKAVARGGELTVRLALLEDVMLRFIRNGDDSFGTLSEPSISPTFSFHSQHLMKRPSPLASTIAPLCAVTGCVVHVRPDESSNVENVVALISTFFPNGTGAPQVIFEQALSEAQTDALHEQRQAARHDERAEGDPEDEVKSPQFRALGGR